MTERGHNVRKRGPNAQQRVLGAAILAAAAWPAGASAQDAAVATRVAVGPQLVPRYPGAKGTVLRPYFDVSRAPVGDPFAFEAPDESFGLTLLNSGALSAGPSLGFEGRRREQDAPGLPAVGFSVELGGFVQYALTDAVRLRTEVRQGITGHKGLVAALSADYVIRDANRQLISIGPRVTVSDARYQGAYFGVDPGDATLSGLPGFDPDGGIQSVGATAGISRALDARWGVTGYVKYDRLVGDAGDSPVVRRFGSRDQFGAGVAVAYTFGPGTR